jgi:hypothetical protein
MTGYNVFYTILHSGYKRAVYWSLDFEGARRYARMIIRNHGQTHGVEIMSLADGQVVWSMKNNETKSKLFPESC